MESARWDERILDAYHEAQDEWRRTASTLDEQPRFWELPLDISDSVLDDAASAIALRIREGRVDSAHACAVFFLHVLRTRLTNVHGSYLWPALSKEICLHGTDVEPDSVADFYRHVLRRTYGTRLAAITHPHRYVVFSLDEAGVGWHRSAIVSEFLDMLLTHWQRDSMVSDTELVDLTLAEFVSSSRQGTDVEALSEVIRRSAAALLLLAREVRTAGLGVRLSMMGWTDMRDFLFMRTGVDLDRVIPEAREAIGRLVPRLGDRLTRAALAGLMRAGTYDIVLPSGVAPAEDMVRVPLMPVRVGTGTLSKVLLVTDEAGQTADAVLATPPDQWQASGHGEWFLWRRQPFRVRLDRWLEEASLPLITGRSPEVAERLGYFWSGGNSRAIPHVDGIGTPPGSSRLDTLWTVDRNGLSLTVRECAVPRRYTGRGKLLVDGEILWIGDIADGYLRLGSQPISLSGCLTRDASLDIRVTDHRDQDLWQAVVENPCRSGSLLTVAGEVQQPGTRLGVPHETFSALGAMRVFLCRPDIQASAEGATLAPMTEDISFPGISLLSVLPVEDSVRIAVGESNWRLERFPEVRLSTDLPNDLNLHGIATSAVGVVPVATSTPIEVSVSGLSAITAGHPLLRDGYLVLQTTSRTHRWRLSDLSHALVGHPDPIRLDVRQLASQRGVHIPNGPVTVTVEASVASAPRSVTFFVCPWTSVSVLPSRLGEPSCVHLVRNDETLASVLGPVVADAGHLTEGAVEIEGILLQLRWMPTVRDATLVSIPGSGSPPLGLREMAGRCSVMLTGGSNWSIHCGGAIIAVDSTQDVDVVGSVLEAVGACGPVTITAFDGLDSIEKWEIDASPVPLGMELSWTETGLEFAASWLGLANQFLSFHLVSDEDDELASPCTAGVHSQPGIMGRSHSGIFHPLVSLIPRDRPLYLEMRSKIQTLAHVVTELPGQFRDNPSPPMVKEDIRRALSASGEAGRPLAARQVLRLAEQYLTLTASMPFSVTALIARLPGADPLTVSGLILLDALARHDMSIEPDLDPDGNGEEVLHWLSLCLIQETRLLAVGQSIPKRFDVIREHLVSLRESLSEDPSSSAWCDVLECLCLHCTGRNCSVSRDALAVCVANPLVRFDKALLDAIASLPTLEVSA